MHADTAATTLENHGHAYPDTYFSKGMEGWHADSFRHIKALIEETFRKRQFQRVLDFGCGDGFYGPLLRQGARHLDGADIADSIRRSPNLQLYDHFEARDLGLPWPLTTERYDFIFSSEVIQHVERYDVFLRNAFDRLADGGVFVLTTTAYPASLPIFVTAKTRELGPRSLFQFAAGLFGNEARGNAFVQRMSGWSKGHRHAFLKRQLKRELERIGFVVDEISYMHARPLFEEVFFSNPFKSARARWLVVPAARLGGYAAHAINVTARKLDLVGSNIVVRARRPAPGERDSSRQER
jgi:2-polyprenyl-3-methyl-5-hydroxy-6-metoxy-1,4-benzoquinol methylase